MEKSGIFYLKSKFFLYRTVTYFGFLLLPVWIQKSLDLNPLFQALLMILYILFISSQWFLLGKEIDHRLKIYFRVNSSIDRVAYRLVLGMTFFILYFNLLSFLPGKWINNMFWTTWVVLGLFYSWPTRGKIIQETVSTNFSEFRYLDSFEKTLLFLILLTFLVSIPEIPKLETVSALKLYFDPLENFNPQFWNFLEVNYYPFKKYPALFKLAWSLHFYVVQMGLFLIIFYAFLRYFVSRRLSILGVFGLLSSWSYSKILANNHNAAALTTYSLYWTWTLLWVTKSSTYRSGLFMGLIGYLGTLIYISFSLLLPVQALLLFFVFLKDKTLWYRKQLLKYGLFGFALTVITVLLNIEAYDFSLGFGSEIWTEGKRIFTRKAFYILAYFGLILVIIKSLPRRPSFIEAFRLEVPKIQKMGITLIIFLVFSLLFHPYLIQKYSVMWFIVLLSLFPIEVIFQSISRLRSSRNMIYLIYILICLLDSHFEGRVKIFLRLLDS